MSKQLSLGTGRVTDNSDQKLESLLAQLKTATDPETIRQLPADIERVIFSSTTCWSATATAVSHRPISRS